LQKKEISLSKKKAFAKERISLSRNELLQKIKNRLKQK
jgi:hypothetical protein